MAKIKGSKQSLKPLFVESPGIEPGSDNRTLSLLRA